MAQRPLDVLILGAGLAGLALAAGLRRLAMRVTLLEKHPIEDDAGAGLLLTGNGLRALERIAAIGAGPEAGASLAARVRGAGRLVPGVRYADAAGRPLFRLAIPTAWPLFLSLRHARLREILLAEAEPVVPRIDVAAGVGHAAAAIAGALAAGGASGDWDLVIGADGVHSDARRALFGGPDPAPIGDYHGWRFLLPDGPSLAEPVQMLGNGRTLLLHPLPDGAVYCGAGPVAPAARVVSGAPGAPDAPDGSDGSRVAGRANAAFSASGSTDRAGWEQLLEAFEGFGGEARAVLDRVDDSTRLIATRYWEVAPARWRSGNRLLIGDAAHGCAPTLAQGAAMAFEDAAVLCEELAGRGDPMGALDRYEARRWGRVAAVQRASRERMAANRPMDAHALAVRDQVLRRFGRQQLEAAWRPLMETMP
jgi:2-polyprenyl-6-methoxyphenol hydroxylase-like FAD-dependent oxidoreductase